MAGSSLPTCRPAIMKLWRGTKDGMCWVERDALDVFSQKTIQRAIFSEPRTWEQPVTVPAGETTVVNFVISQK